MSRFVTDLQLELVDEAKGIYKLLAPLVYDSDLIECMVVVPKDFQTDLASVPRLPFAYALLGNKGQRAAVVHDWAYSGGINVTRETADQLLAEALRACGYSSLVVSLFYAGVRIGGASHFTAPNIPQLPHVAAQMEAP